LKINDLKTEMKKFTSNNENLKEDHILLKNENEKFLLELDEKLKLIEDLKILNKKIPVIEKTENLELNENLKNENDKNRVEESENLKLMIEDLNSQLQLSQEEVHLCIHVHIYIYLCMFV
jgi:hypothetical protein